MRVVIALIFALLGATAFHKGLAQRAEAEPAGLVTGQGLLVGTEGEADVEVRGRPLTQPAVALRRVGWEARSLGVGLLSFGLLLVALRPRRTGPGAEAAKGARWVRLVWLVPGVFALIGLIQRAGAGVPTAALAREAYVEFVAMFGLSFVLLAAWRD